jgi:hypothetical protein
MKMEKRIQIKESDRQSILRLHEKYNISLLSEEVSTERWRTATCAGPKKSTRCKDKVLQVQMKINDKCAVDKSLTKLVEDGIWGPKTSSAFTTCGGTISTQGGQSGNEVQGGQSGNEVQGGQSGNEVQGGQSGNEVQGGQQDVIDATDSNWG